MGTRTTLRPDNPSSERERATSATAQPRGSAPRSPMLASDSSKCPELTDLLGDYSEQTGSFFG